MIVFGTVFYKNATPYLNDFIESINKQSYSDFDLLVINDNIEGDELNYYLSKVKNRVLVINEVGKGKTPVELRIELLKEAKARNYELLVLGDCDDRFDINRVKVIEAIFSHNMDYAFFYNELLLFDGSHALKDMPLETKEIGDILQHNYLGLSNTSINLSLLTFDFIDSLNECNSFVFDWYMFSRIICNGGKGLFVKSAITFYRIYENNFAGISNNTQLEKEIEVKTKHYKLMSKYRDIYSTLLKKLSEFDVEKIQPQRPSSMYWWNNIKL